jgi:hypothetical protein
MPKTAIPCTKSTWLCRGDKAKRESDAGRHKAVAHSQFGEVGNVFPAHRRQMIAGLLQGVFISLVRQKQAWRKSSAPTFRVT